MPSRGSVSVVWAAGPSGRKPADRVPTGCRGDDDALRIAASDGLPVALTAVTGGNKDRCCHQRSRRVAVGCQRVTHRAGLRFQRALGQPLEQRGGWLVEPGDLAKAGEYVVRSHGRCAVP